MVQTGGHSHDRTLLASLGFADPDKKDRRHDLACQYIQQNAKRIGEVLGLENGHHLTSLKAVSLEYHITKGEGQYRTTIGFADAVIHYEVGIASKPYSKSITDESRTEPYSDSFLDYLSKRRDEVYQPPSPEGDGL